MDLFPSIRRNKIAVYGKIGAAPFNFYTGVVPILELNTKEALFHFLDSLERVFCLLLLDDSSKFQAAEGSPKVQLIARRKIGDNIVVLISNQ